MSISRGFIGQHDMHVILVYGVRSHGPVPPGDDYSARSTRFGNYAARVRIANVAIVDAEYMDF